jgi:endonuclease/exonuclease/phosphatase family metal-dependent hydrolase
MKLISLNTWGGGKIFEPLIEFIESHRDSTDILCFQEMSSSPEPGQDEDDTGKQDLFERLENILPDHKGYFAATMEHWHWRPRDYQVAMGNAIFVHKNLEVIENGEVFIRGQKNALNVTEALQGNWFSMPRVLQFVQIKNSDVPLNIFNYHGIWHTSGKGDMPERHEQSDKILKVMEGFEGRKILCGDFNLEMNTESVRKLEENMRNLVKDFKIETTRSDLYPKKDLMPYADYTFVTPDIKVEKFSVPNEPISDHLPMILEFN